MKRMHPKKRLAKMIRNLTLDINTAEYWNRLNPTEKPLDIEDFRVLLDLAKKCDAARTWGEFRTRFQAVNDYALTMAPSARDGGE